MGCAAFAAASSCATAADREPVTTNVAIIPAITASASSTAPVGRFTIHLAWSQAAIVAASSHQFNPPRGTIVAASSPSRRPPDRYASTAARSAVNPDAGWGRLRSLHCSLMRQPHRENGWTAELSHPPVKRGEWGVRSRLGGESDDQRNGRAVPATIQRRQEWVGRLTRCRQRRHHPRALSALWVVSRVTCWAVMSALKSVIAAAFRHV